MAMQNSPLSSSGQLEGSSGILEDNTPMTELRKQVFENELIRDMIFDYVFSSNKDIGTCRLIDRSWLDYVTCRLQNASARPQIYELSFEHWGMSKKFQDKKPKKYQVQQFLETWTSFPGAGSRIPLFSVEFTRPSDVTIKIEEIQDLITSLVRCGNGLSSLTLNLGSSFRNGLKHTILLDLVADLAQVDLPSLKSLEIDLHQTDTMLVTRLLPPILLGCKHLTNLRLTRQFPNDVLLRRLVSEAERDEKIEYLPETLEKIGFKVLMTSELLSNLLLKNSLPNLTQLQLNTERTTDGTDIVSRILHQFSGQLKYFGVEDDSDDRDDYESTLIKFPVMARLLEMSVGPFHSELEPGMEQPFPVLKTLELGYQSGAMMRKWTQNFQFDCVQDLSFIIYNYSGFKDDDFTLELSQQLHVPFPHVQKLHLTCCCSFEDGFMSSIFQHMTQLRTLLIDLDDKLEIVEGTTWDAILLGVSSEYAKNLAECPRGLWDSINLNHLRSPKLSIVNLSNLTSFSLGFLLINVTADQLLSDVAFHFAFLRMPNLQKLTLDRGFGAFKEMVLEWKRQGRKFYRH